MGIKTIIGNIQKIFSAAPTRIAELAILLDEADPWGGRYYSQEEDNKSPLIASTSDDDDDWIM